MSIAENEENPPEAGETVPEEGEAPPKVAKKVAKKVEKVVSQGAKKGEAQNIIGEIEVPEEEAPEEDWRNYFKKVDTKLDQLLERTAQKKDPEPLKEAPKKKQSLWDKKVI